MNDDRLAAARAALARAEEVAASGGGFLAGERERVEGSAAAQKQARRSARERRRAEREERAAAREGRAAAEAAASTPWGAAAAAPEGDAPDWARAVDAAGTGEDSARDGASRDGAAAAAPGAGVADPSGDRPGASGAGRSRSARRSPFEAPEDAPEAVPDPTEVARQIVLRQLATAPRSRAQLATRLAERGCPPDVAESVLDRMTEVGLVDDEEYAAMLVRSQVATRGLARRGLAHELRRKGIDRDLAEAALGQVDADDERRTARALVDKKLRTMGGLGVDVQTRRLAGMLARKGYPSGLAYAVIRDALADAPEHQRD